MTDEKKPDPVKNQEYVLFQRASTPEQDPVLTILRVHLLSEYYLERLIHIRLPRGDTLLDNGNLSYSQKLTVVSALDVLNDRTLQCLKGLNKVRNECAHGIDKTISMTDVESIGRPLGKLYTKYKRESGNSVPEFLHCIFGYLTGHLAGQVTTVEEKAIVKAEKKQTGSEQSPASNSGNAASDGGPTGAPEG